MKKTREWDEVKPAKTMPWEEIKKQLEAGATVQAVADLAGVPYKTMYNRIKWREKQDGKIYMLNSQLRERRKPDIKPVKKAEPVPEEKPAIPKGVIESMTKPQFRSGYEPPKVPEERRAARPEVSPLILADIKAKIAAFRLQEQQARKMAEEWQKIFEWLKDGGQYGR